MILERDQLKAPLAYASKDSFFQKKAVRVGDQSQPSHIRSELSENLVSPVTHGCLPQP